MLVMMISFFALIVAFAALWFAGEANQRAEFQQQQFYDAHVKTLKGTVANTVRAANEIARRVNDMEKILDSLVETHEELNIGATLSDLNGGISSLRQDLDSISQGLSEPRPLRRRLV